jgi:uncharacterized membrane protein
MFSISHLHPMVVHFPIALVLIGFLAEVVALYFKKESCLSFAGFYLLLLGTLGAAVAYFTGSFFTPHFTDVATQSAKDIHSLFATFTLWILIINSLLRIYLKWKKKENTSWKWVAFALYAIAVLFVSITGFLGGSIVYDHLIH